MKYGNEKRLDRITYQDILKIGNDMKQKIEELSEIIPPALEELESLAYENGIICTYMKLKNDILERNRALMKSRTY